MEKNIINHIYQDENISYEDIKRTQDRIDSSGEIFTPPEIVNKMLDRVKPEDWSNPEITIIEPSCGDGNFVVKIIERFMEGLTEIIIDPQDRFKHIIENQVFALDIMPDNINATLNRIDSIWGYNIRQYDHNILNKDSIEYDWSFGQDWEDEYGMVHPAEPKHYTPNDTTIKSQVKKPKLKETSIDDFFI
ncbi:MAG: restriction endonuclease [Caudoviricetes sp.]|nr:MAG: restriction endonuclease [Caudoviricetes sp.]